MIRFMGGERNRMQVVMFMKAIGRIIRSMGRESIRMLVVDGTGKYSWADGGVYEGDWKDGKMHGKGKYSYANGGVYEGDWKDGKMHGKGKYSFANGDVYEGYFE